MKVYLLGTNEIGTNKNKTTRSAMLHEIINDDVAFAKKISHLSVGCIRATQNGNKPKRRTANGRSKIINNDDASAQNKNITRFGWLCRSIQQQRAINYISSIVLYFICIFMLP